MTLASFASGLGRGLFLRTDRAEPQTLQNPRRRSASKLNARSNVVDATKESPARFLATSSNSKLSPVEKRKNPARAFGISLHPRAPFVSSTYVSIEKTCPSSCPFKRRGCYADSGFTRVMGKKLDDAAADRTALEVIKAEVQLIDRAWTKGIPQDGARGGRDLRLHVGGETPSEGAASLLAGAAARWMRRGGGAVWTFTHNWARIARSAWGRVSVLASCETPAQAWAAVRRGYVPALVVDRFPAGAKAFEMAGLKFIPCPGEVSAAREKDPAKRVTCATCRLCLTSDQLAERALGIAFEAHGTKSNDAREALFRANGGKRG